MLHRMHRLRTEAGEINRNRDRLFCMDSRFSLAEKVFCKFIGKQYLLVFRTLPGCHSEPQGEESTRCRHGTIPAVGYTVENLIAHRSFAMLRMTHQGNFAKKSAKVISQKVSAIYFSGIYMLKTFRLHPAGSLPDRTKAAQSPRPAASDRAP